MSGQGGASMDGRGDGGEALESLHPAVRTWFERRFPEGPTAPQERGWPEIAKGRDTLIAAPTGTGKTLSAFLVCIDRLFRAAERFELRGAERPTEADGPPRITEVVYVSPLKALAADIRTNLQTPLEEIREVARELGLPAPEIRVALRSGDTPASERAAMLKNPPHLLVTTPESLYLFVTADRSREILRGVRTVIVDEIHALARDKRGSHLAITLERLDALCETRPARIGLSATQRPIETVARLLVGAGPGRILESGAPNCAIVDEGHRRELDLALELPDSELEAVASNEQLGEVLDRISLLVADHRTTLVFVNTRRMAERIAHLLAERLGDDAVASHHGSLSKERRQKVEARLRAGDLRALVATASLELGIDVGPVELVCQIGSPRSLATFLQRVGRSGHTRHGTPKGRLYPLTRDELVECAALMRGVRAGRLDAVLPPEAPLDILAQQIVAACGAEEWNEDELYALVCQAAPFATLERERFDEVVAMLSDGIHTGRGRRAAWLHRDRVRGVVRARRGARLAALTSGGAIPERADYRVLLDPDDTFVGTVDEDWAIESMAGDIFLLGSTSWRIRRVEQGIVRVQDAQGAPPTIPFWFGEAPARTAELSGEVSSLRGALSPHFERGELLAARRWLADECGLDDAAQAQVVAYLAASHTALGGHLPTQDEIVYERFFDESGGMQLVVHSPFGGRLNRAFGLALRKRFCRNFDFELQAAANDDAFVLSLGPQQSFPLEDTARFLHSSSVREALEQAALRSPMFTARWRWNLNRSLAVLRMRGGKRNPPPIQRMEAEDLMAAVFPALAQCQEHANGPIEIPDHPIVRQTMDDCLTEAMDAEGLEDLVRDLEEGRLRTHFVDSTEPSPLSHEILNGRPYTFLDDAPLEERRTRAVKLRRGLPVDARDLARLDPEAIERVRSEAAAAPRDVDELHDWLLVAGVVRPNDAWREWFDRLVSEDRARALELPASLAGGGGWLWVATERIASLASLYPGARIRPERELPAALAALPIESEHDAAIAIVRGQLEASGPVAVPELGERTALSAGTIEIALAALEAEGVVLRGRFTPESNAGGPEEFCARRLLTRIHSYTQERLRSEIEPVTAQDYLRFLLRWHHVAPGTRREGRRGTLAAIEQLQGFELAAGAWESDVLPARIAGYSPAHLDALCLSGDVSWGRLAARQPSVAGRVRDRGLRAGASPSRATPIALFLRADLAWLLRASQGETSPRGADEAPGAAIEDGSGASPERVRELLGARGALFASELATLCDATPLEVEQALWELVAHGHVTADGFQALRGLLGSREGWARRVAARRVRRGLRRGAAAASSAEGRWSLLGSVEDGTAAFEMDALAEAMAEQLLARWGVVFKDVLARENLGLPWRELLWAFRRLEARGTIRGGRFVTGFVGEQYALPGAVDALRRTRRLERSGEIVRLSAADPLNLVGIVTPGPRIPAVRGGEVVYRDGVPEQASVSARAGRTLH